jgi:hypothetical protein
MRKLNERPFKRNVVACFTLWIALGVVPATAAGLYKWTDDQGAVHYSDQIPPDAVNKGGVVFDKQGHPLKKIDPSLTPAQLKAKQVDDEHQRVLAKVQEDKSRRDMALVHSYTSEDEIDYARNRSLQAVESQLKSAEVFTSDLTKRQQQLNKDKLAYGTKPVPPTLESELSGLDEEIARQEKVMAQRRAEMTAINAKYEGDKLRWRELRADQKPPTSAVSTPPANTPAGPQGRGAGGSASNNSSTSSTAK